MLKECVGISQKKTNTVESHLGEFYIKEKNDIWNLFAAFEAVIFEELYLVCTILTT